MTQVPATTRKPHAGSATVAGWDAAWTGGAKTGDEPSATSGVDPAWAALAPAPEIGELAPKGAPPALPGRRPAFDIFGSFDGQKTLHEIVTGILPRKVRQETERCTRTLTVCHIRQVPSQRCQTRERGIEHTVRPQ